MIKSLNSNGKVEECSNSIYSSYLPVESLVMRITGREALSRTFFRSTNSLAGLFTCARVAVLERSSVL